MGLRFGVKIIQGMGASETNYRDYGMTAYGLLFKACHWPNFDDV